MFANPAHGKVEAFFFTSDDQAFRTEHEANGQAQNIVRSGKASGGTVDKVTRAEYEAFVNGSIGLTPALSKGEGAEGEVAEGEGGDVAEIEHVITQEDLDNNPDLGVQGVNVGDNVQIPVDSDPKMSPEEAKVAIAEHALSVANAGGDADAIATAKKALSTARAAYTRSLKK